jgi:hypothetical protein
MLDPMQRGSGPASGISTIPARLLVLVLCTAMASSAVQLLQRPGTAIAGLPPTASATPSGTPTSTATGTASSTPSSTPTATATGTASSTPTNTATGTASGTPTNTATVTATATITTTPPATPTITPTAEVGALCSDGIDNNLNGLIDCADPSCAGSEPCIAAAPAMSPVLLLLALAALSLIGLLQLRRRLR